MDREKLAERLREICGRQHVLTDESALAAYAYDASRRYGSPDVVASPGSESEIQEILKLASGTGTPIVPRGAASGLTGGSVASCGGIVLSFERLDRILEIDAANRIAVVQPGVVTGRFQAEVEKLGLFYPPDPGSLAFCTLGGNVAENAGGMRAVKYGVTRDYVLGLRAVLASGEVVKTGVRTAKGVVGYDLTRLLVGSEGTLGVITEITLRLVPKPETVVTMTAIFSDPVAAGRAVAEVMASPVTPRCMEFMDGNALKAGAGRAGMELPDGAGAFILAETDGGPDEAARQADIVRAILARHAVEVRLAADASEAAALWKLRRSASQALFTLAPDKINEDIVVPVGRIPDALDEAAAIAKRRCLTIVCFGHAGDGNIHVNVMTDFKDERMHAAAEEAVEEVFAMVLRLGGTISGEHGIGLAKLPYIGMEQPAHLIELQKRVKAAFDPEGILNPGKIFP